MIESQEKREQLIKIIDHWAEFCLLKQHLRNGDIGNLVNDIIEEFYTTSLSCGHQVRSIDGGILIGFNDVDRDGNECEVQGIYCKDCAEKYKKELGAWEIKTSEVENEK
ncbi:MAG: hypothetical protein WC389_15605 [Lutibacter sp.]|jgi:hypothetical protein